MDSLTLDDGRRTDIYEYEIGTARERGLGGGAGAEVTEVRWRINIGIEMLDRTEERPDAIFLFSS